jgi:hypothetical protein
MLRKPNPRTLIAAFLSLSAALSVILLAVRNLYDDEIASLYLVISRVSDILTLSKEGDVHPPGMYLLAHLTWRLLPSFRWMNLVPGIVLYIGLAVFLFQIVPLFTRTRSQLCLLLLATLHPQLLLWGTTFRWYSWWTGIALVALTIALQPREPRPTLSTPRAITLGLLLACLFYLNYITFLFAFALAAAMLLRYRSQPPKPLAARALLIAGIFIALIAPQLNTMLTIHIPDADAQRYGVVVSTLRLLQSIAASEAYLPWHPLAILASLLFAALCVFGGLGLLRIARRPREGARPQTPGSALASIVLFGLLFFLLVAASGLGGKPRNGLLLIPALAPIAALIVENLRSRTQTAILIFFALWSAVGVAHLLGRYGLTKSTMNDRPEQVVAFVERRAAQPTQACSVVATYDTDLAFALTQAHLPRTLILSPYRGTLFGGETALPPEGCAYPRLYAVQSFVSGSALRVSTFNGELQIAEQYIQGPPATDSFSLDPDARFKRRAAALPALGSDFASAARLPDYRYVVTSGPIDRASIEEMRHRMTHFLSGEDPDATEN